MVAAAQTAWTPLLGHEIEWSTEQLAPVYRHQRTGHEFTQDGDGNTELHAAAYADDWGGLVRLLPQMSAEAIAKPNAAGDTACDLAVRAGHPVPVALLLSTLPPAARVGVLMAASAPYFPDGGVTADSFVPVGERWALPALKRQLKEHPEAEEAIVPTAMRAVRCFIAVQVLLAKGHEDELAAIVEATEAVHRMPFYNVLKNTVYNEPGCPGLLHRVGGLAARLEQRSGGEPPKQTTSDLNELLHNVDAEYPKLDALVTILAQKTGCTGFKLARTRKSPVRVCEKEALSPGARIAKYDAMPAAEMASELRQRGIEHGGDGTPEVNLRAMLVLADLDAAGPADYSSSCDVGRHALAYGNTSQLDNAVQYLQSLDDAEAAHTQINRSVFGADTDRLRIVLLRTKNRIGEPNSSFYSDLMLNLMFADDPTETVHELQLQHTDLATIRNEGSHTYYNKTRSARELLEARGEEARIPAVDLEPPQLPAAGGGAGGAGGGGGGGASAAAVARLQAELKAVKATGVQQAAELKAVRATVAEQADRLTVLEAAIRSIQRAPAESTDGFGGFSSGADGFDDSFYGFAM